MPCARPVLGVAIVVDRATDTAEAGASKGSAEMVAAAIRTIFA
jgi:hypothetical protein